MSRDDHVTRATTMQFNTPLKTHSMHTQYYICIIYDMDFRQDANKGGGLKKQLGARRLFRDGETSVVSFHSSKPIQERGALS